MNRKIRILIVNRMAAMERGGGETFDLEMARHLAALDCHISILTGIPLFGKAKLGPEEWWGREGRPQTKGDSPQTIDHSIEGLNKLDMVGVSQGGALGGLDKVSRYEEAYDKGSSAHGLRSLAYLRTPCFSWFPWDRVRGGWRLRAADFMMFERAAARWAWKHRDWFDVIQVCELPFFVCHFKRLERSTKHQAPSTKHEAPSTKHIPIIIRLTAPNAYDPVGGIKMADAVIASGTSIEPVRQLLRSDCHDVPNGVDIEKFKPHDQSGQGAINNLRSSLRVPADAPVLLYVARFQSFKQHSLLLRAFREVLAQEPKARLVLVGSGPLSQSMAKNARQLDVHHSIDFVGEVSYPELPSFYALADIKVIASEYESFCFAAIEAMASGLPLVTTDCGWVPGLVGDTMDPVRQQEVDQREDSTRFVGMKPGNNFRRVPGGFIVKRGDAESLANAIVMMIRDPGLRKKCGVWNRERVIRDYTWKASAGNLKNIYRELLSE